MTSIADPRDFLCDRRFDLGVKYKFFRHLIHADDPDAERLYRWHIEKRNGACEGWKQSTDDFVAACRDLLASMQAKGFDPQWPVKIGTNGLLMAGAHRIACALLLRHPLHVHRRDVPGRAAPWDLRWFEVRGLSACDRAILVREWILLKKAHEARDRLHPSVDGASAELGLCVQGGA